MCEPKQDVEKSGGCGGKCGASCPNAALKAKKTAKPPEIGAGGDASPPPAVSLITSAPSQQSTQKPEHPNLDVVTTFGADGRRIIPQPSQVRGLFTSARALTGFLLIAVYLSLPWISVNGAPAVFLDIEHRRFHLFGATFLSQDLWLVFFLISGLGFALFTVTALLGRIWCGWACPLTVFLNVVRRIERWIEGDAHERKRLELVPWTLAKTLRRILKHVAMVLLATLVAHGFLAYFVSIPQLFKMMHEAPSQHLGAFLLVAAATGVLWFCFAWFREQFCIVLCPYGRLQSVLTDEQTLVIGYDEARGEPRGHVRRGAAPATSAETAGDCVDCFRCVQVCPTGIDIRQGLQLECIGCAACVDACDTVMAKLHRPSGLIRYDSLAGLRGGKRRFWRPRLALYGALMVAGLVAACFAFSTVRFAVVSLTRLPGAPYFVQDGVLRNQFLIRVFNKRALPSAFEFSLEGALPEGLTFKGETREAVGGWGEMQTPLVVTVQLEKWSTETPLWLVVRDSGGKLVAKKPFTLMGPMRVGSTSSVEIRTP